MKRITHLLTAALLLTPTLGFADDHASDKKLLTTTTTISGQPITVPVNPKMQASIITIEPGKSLPVHKHPYIRYAYVQKGELDVTLVDEKKSVHFKAGDAFAEIIDGWHFGTNNGSVPTQLLVIDQMPQDATTNTVPKN